MEPTLSGINPNEFTQLRKDVALIKDILLSEKFFQDSIIHGEQDIREGNVTSCKTKEDLDNFFASI